MEAISSFGLALPGFSAWFVLALVLGQHVFGFLPLDFAFCLGCFVNDHVGVLVVCFGCGVHHLVDQWIASQQGLLGGVLPKEVVYR